MKKTLFAMTLLVGLLLPLAPRAQAETEVSLNLFYDNLSTEGNWIEVGDYGYCFQPNVAVSDTSWRPYADGYWAYTDAGWTWVSYENFGWATYHYGRWTRLEDYGWVWVPGFEWAPAWVSWRTGGDYIGWAPLPPAAEPVYEGRAITGHVDVEFDIGPTYYNFVEVRYIGEPVLRQRLVEPARNVTIINNTVNVTNITYNNKTVITAGPNFEQVNRYAARPVRRMTLQRETTVASLNLQNGARRNFNQVNGNELRVVAPQLQKPTQKMAPKQVKATVKTPKIEHGWKNVPDKEKLQARMKSEDAKNVPPPTIQPRQDGNGEAAAAGAQGAQPNDNGNAAPANENNGAEERGQRAGRAARRNPANAQKPQGATSQDDAGNAGNDESSEAARKAERAKRTDQTNQVDNPGQEREPRARQGRKRNPDRPQAAEDQNPDRSQAAGVDSQANEQRPRNAGGAERSQAADDSTSEEQQQQHSGRADRRDQTNQDQRPARRAQRDETSRGDQNDNRNDNQPDRAPQQERRNARQQNQADQQPQAEQPIRHQPRQHAAESDDSQRPGRTEQSQSADRADRAPGQQHSQADRQERAQRREQRQSDGAQNAPEQRKRKKPAQESTPAQPQP